MRSAAGRVSLVPGGGVERIMDLGRCFQVGADDHPLLTVFDLLFLLAEL